MGKPGKVPSTNDRSAGLDVGRFLGAPLPTRRVLNIRAGSSAERASTRITPAPFPYPGCQRVITCIKSDTNRGRPVRGDRAHFAGAATEGSPPPATTHPFQ